MDMFVIMHMQYDSEEYEPHKAVFASQFSAETSQKLAELNAEACEHDCYYVVEVTCG